MRVIILKSLEYINYSNENIIKKNIKTIIIIYVNNYYICKKTKVFKNREHNLLQLFSISQKR